VGYGLRHAIRWNKKAEDKRQNLNAGIIQMYRLTRNGIRPVMAAA
jgi:hypothetical protein